MSIEYVKLYRCNEQDGVIEKRYIRKEHDSSCVENKLTTQNRKEKKRRQTAVQNILN